MAEYDLNGWTVPDVGALKEKRGCKMAAPQEARQGKNVLDDVLAAAAASDL
jgi:hypothetical protein